MQLTEKVELPSDSSDHRWYALRNLVFSKRLDEAKQLIVERPSLLTETNSCGETALHFLAVENDLQGVAWLHEKGQSVDSIDAFGEPVIFAVAKLRYRELFEWFVNAGADITVCDADGLNLLAHLREWDVDDMADWISEKFK